MATITNLAKANIIRATDDFVEVKHPDLSGRLKTYLTANCASNGAALTVTDNHGWASGDVFVIGYPGRPQTEQDTISAAVTTGTSVTVATNTRAFAHDANTPVFFAKEKQIRIKGADTLTGVQTAVTGSPFTITWSKPSTVCKATGTQYAYYFAEYSDGAGSPVYGSQSDGVARTGLAANTAEEIIQNALDLCDEEINDNGKLTRRFLLREFNNWQDDVRRRKNWSFEIVDEETITSTTLTNKYALSGLTSDLKYTNSNQGIIAVRFGDEPLIWMDWHEYLECMEGVAYTTLVSSTLAAAITCTLTDSYEFAEAGTILIGADTATYTANAQATGVLTGIPASGTGYLSEAHTAGDAIWQGVSAGKPNKYCIYNDYIYLDRPVSSTYAGIKLKFSFYKELTAASEMTDTTDITCYYVGQYFLASRIEYKKGNLEKGNQWMAIYEAKLKDEVRKDRRPSEKRWTPVGGYDEIEGAGKWYKSEESSIYNNS